VLRLSRKASTLTRPEELERKGRLHNVMGDRQAGASASLLPIPGSWLFGRSSMSGPLEKAPPPPGVGESDCPRHGYLIKEGVTISEGNTPSTNRSPRLVLTDVYALSRNLPQHHNRRVVPKMGGGWGGGGGGGFSGVGGGGPGGGLELERGAPVRLGRRDGSAQSAS